MFLTIAGASAMTVCAEFYSTAGNLLLPLSFRRLTCRTDHLSSAVHQLFTPVIERTNCTHTVDVRRLDSAHPRIGIHLAVAATKRLKIKPHAVPTVHNLYRDPHPSRARFGGNAA